MDASTYRRKLESFLTTDVIRECDYVTYVMLLHDLSKKMETKDGFPIYAEIVKKWIGEFENIFGNKKTNNNAFWEIYTSKFCGSCTKTLFNLLQCFCEFEPIYKQEFYSHWKTIVSRMDERKRAEAFHQNIEQFKMVIHHLRMASSRTEQFSIMSVLQFYIDCVPTNSLQRLQEDNNAEIIKMVGGFMENPTILNRHTLFHRINALGQTIESFKPTKIVCRKLNIDMDDTVNLLWIDLNKVEQTVSFGSVFLADCHNQTFATSRRVRMRVSVEDKHLLEIRGFWNVISVNGIQSTGQRVTVKVHFMHETEELITTAVKTIFRFVNSGDAFGSVSQGNPCHVATLDEEHLYKSPAGFTSDYPETYSSPNGNYSERTVSSETATESDAELPIQSKLTLIHLSPSSGPLATYVSQESVNPPETPECPSMQLDTDNESQVSNRTYTICKGPLSRTLIEANRLTDHDMVFDEDHAYDGSENAQDDSQYASKNIEIIENITIVPPTAHPQLLEPIQNLTDSSRQNIEYSHSSQADVAVSREEVSNQYSQPTTKRERFHVKNSSFRSRHMGHIESNESGQRSPQKPIVKLENFGNIDGRNDQLDRSVRSDLKEWPIEFSGQQEMFSPSVRLKRMPHSELSSQHRLTRQSQATPWPCIRLKRIQYSQVYPWPIEFSGQQEMFSPSVRMKRMPHSELSSHRLTRQSQAAPWPCIRLKRIQCSQLASQSQSRIGPSDNAPNLHTIRFDEADLGNEATRPDYVTTDGITVDEHGTVYDDNGSVFRNYDKLQRAAKFYIANDGLNFLTKKTLPASDRKKYERQMRTIQRMIDRGLERLRIGAKPITGIEVYTVTDEERTIQDKTRRPIRPYVSVKRTQ